MPMDSVPLVFGILNMGMDASLFYIRRPHGIPLNRVRTRETRINFLFNQRIFDLS